MTDWVKNDRCRWLRNIHQRMHCYSVDVMLDVVDSTTSFDVFDLLLNPDWFVAYDNESLSPVVVVSSCYTS
jgi:hypothetical protein